MPLYRYNSSMYPNNMPIDRSDISIYHNRSDISIYHNVVNVAPHLVLHLSYLQGQTYYYFFDVNNIKRATKYFYQTVWNTVNKRV